ncbi:MAG: DUF4384 domain-containing protein, partial [Rhodobacteraceae bacterium]|nr:DUF4384 domain-containing protein [Paracoccaceae bacterium]
WLDQIHTDKVTVILDACFSGTATRMGESVRLKTMDFGYYPPQRKTKVTLGRKQIKHVLLAASSPEQISWMLADQKGSVFTTILADVLVNLTATATYDALMNAVIPQVQQYVAHYYADQEQTPQLEGNGQTPLFFGADSSAQPVTPPPTPVPTPETPSEDVQYDDFPLSISTNQPEYREKDLMTVTVEAARNCYVRLYLINARQAITQLFPNAYQQDNFIRAGQPVQIPGTGARFYLEMTPPFGTETLKAVASTVQFEDLLDVDWQGKTFLDFRKMLLSDMNTRGVAVRKISDVEISQAVERYRVRSR